jgi:competence protein ComEC
MEQICHRGCRLQTDASGDISAEPSSLPVSADTTESLPDTDEFSVLFVNVGKADAAVLRFGETTVLIDTGSKASAPQLIAGLNLLGITEIDLVFLTHSHSDHIGGLEALSSNYAISMVYSPFFSEQTKKGEGKIVKRCEKLSLPHTELKAGSAVTITDDVSFSVLGPLELNEDDDNDNSLILRFTVRGTTFLFTGDMQFAEEDTLLAAGIDLSADVLKVGNHGNPDATSDAFASAVSPSLAMISTDTSVDTNSANHRVIASLSGAEVFLTEDYPLGILLTLDDNGNPMVTNPIQQEDSLQLALFALEPDSQLLTLLNYGDTPADLSGCILYSERSGAVQRIPEGTLLAPDATLTISGSEGDGDLRFSGEKKPFSKKKKNTVIVYSPLGAEISTLHQ